MYYDDDPPQGSGCARGMVILGALIAVGAIIIYFSLNNAASRLNPFGNAQITNPLAAQPTAINANRPAVVQSIRSLNRLEATTYIAEKVIEAGQQGNAVYNIFLGDKLLLIAHGEVIAGFDLAKISEQSIQVSADGQTVALTMPPSEILTYKLDNSKTAVYDRQTGVATRGNPGLETEARRIAEQEILRSACEGGVLTRAATDGQRDMELLLKGLGFKNITVTASAGPCTLPGGAPLP